MTANFNKPLRRWPLLGIRRTLDKDEIKLTYVNPNTSQHLCVPMLIIKIS